MRLHFLNGAVQRFRYIENRMNPLNLYVWEEL